MTKQLTLTEKWIKERPFLEELAKFHEKVAVLLKDIHFEAQTIETLDQAKNEFQRGIPLLKCENTNIPVLDSACQTLAALTALENFVEVPQPFRDCCSAIRKTMEQDDQFLEAVIKSLLNEDFQPLYDIMENNDLNEGVIWFLGWTAIAYALQPNLPQLIEWEEEQAWNKEYCPTCGALPSMAQLKRSTKGRKRHLVCGCCKTEWVYKRMGCPYCKNEDPEKLRIMEIDEEDDVRVDVCNSCNGYIKVYTNKGEEEAALLDWTTLHLDILLKERGYLKMGTHLLNL